MMRLASVRVETGLEVEGLTAQVTGEGFILLQVGVLVFLPHVRTEPEDRS